MNEKATCPPERHTMKTRNKKKVENRKMFHFLEISPGMFVDPTRVEYIAPQSDCENETITCLWLHSGQRLYINIPLSKAVKLLEKAIGGHDENPHNRER